MTHWPKLFDALQERVEDVSGCVLNVHPDALAAYLRSRKDPPLFLGCIYGRHGVRMVDNPLMLEGVAILVKNDIIQAVVNLEDGRSMETL
jgi:hypothetical protein